MNEDALAVMVRVPIEGAVKTRLLPELTAKQACQLYEAFLKDLFSRLSELTSTDIFIFYAIASGHKAVFNGTEVPVDKVHILSDIVPESFTLTPQKDGDIGIRMHGAFKYLFDQGYKRVALIGSDSPDLPLATLERTYATLKGPCGEEPRRLVLGPAMDGGYYLIAMNRSLLPCSAPLFTGINWSTPAVLQETLAVARAGGMDLAMLPQWYDIDTYDDLVHIKGSSELPATMLVLQGFADCTA